MATSTRTGSAKSNGNGSSSHTAEEFETQLTQIREDIAALAKNVEARGHEKLHEAQGHARDAKDELTGAYDKAIRSVRAEAGEIESDLSRRVRDHPLQALGLAAGVGFVAALLTRR